MNLDRDMREAKIWWDVEDSENVGMRDKRMCCG